MITASAQFSHCECRDCMNVIVGKGYCSDCLFSGCEARDMNGPCCCQNTYSDADEEPGPWVNVS